MRLNIEKLVYGGDGLARSDGRVVLLPFVWAGEEVDAEVERAKNDLLRGRVVEIVSPSTHRVAPPCPYFYRCGGCQYQHATYEAQLEQKTAILREVLRRVGKFEYEGEIGVVAGEPWQYRNRAQLHISDGAIGYFESGSHRLCPVEQCPISSPKLNEAIGVLSREIPKLPRFESELELFTNEAEVQYLASERAPLAARALFGRIGTTVPIEYGGFRVSRNSFFQVNRFLLDGLVEAAAGASEGGAAVDLYAGVGLFARALKHGFGRVTAVESGASAHRDLQRNATGVNAIHGTAEQFLTELKEAPDLMLADPPRAGLGKAAVTELVRIDAPQLRIVSCDPATLARDVRLLLAAGYRIERLTMVDLFPQTFHIESVVWLRK